MPAATATERLIARARTLDTGLNPMLPDLYFNREVIGSTAHFGVTHAFIDGEPARNDGTKEEREYLGPVEIGEFPEEHTPCKRDVHDELLEAAIVRIL